MSSIPAPVPRASGDVPPLPAEEVVISLRTNPRSRALDELAALASRLLGVSSAEVALMDSVRTVIGVHSPFSQVHDDPVPLEESLCANVQRTLEPVAVPDACVDVRTKDLQPVLEGRVRAYLGVPLSLDSGEVVGVLCVFDPSPKEWSAPDAELLSALARVCATELELEALHRVHQADQVVMDLALSAAGVGVFEWDLATGSLEWDERLRSLFGYGDDFGGTIAAFKDRVHPDDLPMVSGALDAAIRQVGVYSAEYRAVLPGGKVRHLAARGRVFADSAGKAERLLGAVYDMTPNREDEARLGNLLDGMALGFLYLDRSWRTLQVNSEAERVLGTSRSDLLGCVLWEALPALRGTSLEGSCLEAVKSGEAVTLETYYPAPLRAWFEVRVTPEPSGLAVHFLDITAHKAAQEASEHAVARSSLLAAVAAELTGALEVRSVAERLPPLLVPALADWCALTWSEASTDAAVAHHTTTWHAQESLRPRLAKAVSSCLAHPSAASLMAEVFSAPRPTLVPGGSPELRVASEALLADLGSLVALVLPLRGRQGPLGLLVLGWDEPPERERDDFFGLASEVADQVGLSLDNARLYAHQRSLAETMQRSLLTEPVEPDHLQVAVRYAPAAQEAQVGGDWYDAFLVRDGSTALVVGDVSGHDKNAAALMAQVRNILRGVAHALPGEPSGVLSALDNALADLGVGVLATAVLAKVEKGPAAASLRKLRWSNAGHPPPLLLNADGTYELLDGEPDLLLGFDPMTNRTDNEHAITPGSTVLFYTDGLVERRSSTLDEGIAHMSRVAAELAPLDLESFCDALLARLSSGADDDVVLLAVRAHPEDQPRPSEAGPSVLPDDLRKAL